MPSQVHVLGKLRQNTDATNLPQLRPATSSSHLEKFLKAPISYFFFFFTCNFLLLNIFNVFD